MAAKASRSSESRISRLTSSVSGSIERMFDDLLERQVSQNQFGGDALALGPRGQPRKLVTRLLFVGLGENFSQVGELKSLVSDDGGKVHGSAPARR